MKQLLLLPAMMLGVASAEVSPESENLMRVFSQEAAEQLMKSVSLAEKSAPEGQKNFVTLARSLVGFGLGESPQIPARFLKMRKAAEKKSGKPPETGEVKIGQDRKNAMSTRMKMMGQMDKDFLQRLDANKDLMVDAKEVAAALRARLVFLLDDKLKLDRNGDQQLSLTEYALSVQVEGNVGEDGVDEHQRGHFVREDQNKDGWVSEKEFSALSAKAPAIWKKLSPQGKPFSLKKAIPTLYWLRNAELQELRP